MDSEIRLQQVLLNKTAYKQRLPQLFKLLSNSPNKSQILKDIVLFCKTCLTISSKLVTKFLAVHLIKDIAQKELSEQFMKLIEISLLKKMQQICTSDVINTQQRMNRNLQTETSNFKLTQIDQQQKRIGQDFIRICIECIYMWSKAYENNKTSKFNQASEYLKSKKIKFPVEFKYFDKTKKLILKSASTNKLMTEESKSNLSLSQAVSIDNKQSEIVVVLMQSYQSIQEYIQNQYKKAEKSSSYKIKIKQILLKLNTFINEYKLKQKQIPKQSNFYDRLMKYNIKSETLVEKLKNKKISDQNSIKIIIQELIINRTDSNQQSQQEQQYQNLFQYIPKKFQIFSILENIHKKIEEQQKKLGLYGNYEFNKNFSLKNEEQVSSFLQSEKVLSPNYKNGKNNFNNEDLAASKKSSNQPIIKKQYKQ